MSAQVERWPPGQEMKGLANDWHEQRLHTLSDANEFTEAMVQVMEEKHCTAKDVFAVRLALEEALVNAMVHGNGSDPEKAAATRYCVLQDRIIIEIEDEGDGFDPAQVPDPLAPENLGGSSGRGLLLMRSYMTWVWHNERGNRVVLCRERSSRAP